MLLLLSLPPPTNLRFLSVLLFTLVPPLPLSSQKSWPKPQLLVCLVTKGYHESETPKITRNILSQSWQPFPTDSHAKITLPLYKSYPGDALSFCLSDQKKTVEQSTSKSFHNTTSRSDLLRIHMETLQRMPKKTEMFMIEQTLDCEGSFDIWHSGEVQTFSPQIHMESIRNRWCNKACFQIICWEIWLCWHLNGTF